ncbi:hypothetical protein LTR66_005233, partial [Elasticomyces elasticus]
MATERTLPERRNPLLREDGPVKPPSLNTLKERRRLGQTELNVKPGQVGTSNATKPENLGMFDYAHLRVPLPPNLAGSGIFKLQKNKSYPESYFLMRRSSDGFISATGMFKAAFPWASNEEEEEEKRYIKSRPYTDGEEVAGNVWIPPQNALELAEEYDMQHWIVALLDPEPIQKGTTDPAKRIASPPTFLARPSSSNGASPAPHAGNMFTRGRSLRSASPSKSTQSPRKYATPRRGRPRKPLQSTLSKTMENASDTGASAGLDPVNGEVNGPVTVEVESTFQPSADGEEVTSTTVKVELPTSHPDLPLPEDAQGMIEMAKRMVEEANKLDGKTVGSRKRKAEELEVDDEEDELMVQPAKRARVLETQLRKEKIKRRAMVGIAGALAFGAFLPTLMDLIPAVLP